MYFSLKYENEEEKSKNVEIKIFFLLEIIQKLQILFIYYIISLFTRLNMFELILTPDGLFKI